MRRILPGLLVVLLCAGGVLIPGQAEAQRPCEFFTHRECEDESEQERVVIDRTERGRMNPASSPSPGGMLSRNVTRMKGLLTARRDGDTKIVGVGLHYQSALDPLSTFSLGLEVLNIDLADTTTSHRVEVPQFELRVHPPPEELLFAPFLSVGLEVYFFPGISARSRVAVGGGLEFDLPGPVTLTPAVRHLRFIPGAPLREETNEGSLTLAVQPFEHFIGSIRTSTLHKAEQPWYFEFSGGYTF